MHTHTHTHAHTHTHTSKGAYLVQKLAQKLDTFLSESPNYGRGKECDCVLLLIGHLYTFKVFKSNTQHNMYSVRVCVCLCVCVSVVYV